MLDPALDRVGLAAALATRSRLQIQGFLVPDAAAALHECLAGMVPWSLACIENGTPRTIPPGQLRAMSPSERGELLRRIHASARDGYQFMYHSYMMVPAYLAGRDPDLPLHRLLEYLNSGEFLAWMCELTGDGSLIKADAQATCYLPGNFLKYHTDEHSADGRRFAYVINLTREWQADWGGLLQFMDASGAVVDTFLPLWNSLSIFKVPAPHCVSCVAPYARVPRLSITGWLRSA